MTVKTVIAQGSTIAEVAARSTTDVVVVTPTKVRVNNSALLAETGLRIAHFLPQGYDGSRGNLKRGVTVAYRQHNKSVIEIATAVCHSKDQFSKKLGTRTAIDNFQLGHTVFIPRYAPLAEDPRSVQDQVANQVAEMFGDWG